MIEQALSQHLATHAGVLAVVAGRVHPLVIPQTDRGEISVPCLVYQVIGRDRSKTHCETIATVRTVMQIDAYGRSYASAKQASEACIAALLDFRGDMGTAPAAVFVRDIEIVSEIDLTDPEPGLYRVSNTFNVWHSPR